MKKLLSVILTIALLCTLTVTAFADDTFKLTITGAAGHKYDVYQVYTGDLSVNANNQKVLSNVKYGVNHYPVNGVAGDPVPADELAALTDAQTAMNLLDSALKGDPIAPGVKPAEGENSIEITGLAPGYYMIVDVTDTELVDETKSPIMLQIVGDTTVASKHAGISSEKKVDDKNDSKADEDAVNWQDSADYDIGDTVPFQLSATIPSTFLSYDVYELTFHDMQAAGFAAPQNIVITIVDSNGDLVDTLTADEYVVTNGACGEETCEFGANCSFNIKITDLTASLNSYAEGYKILVEYTSVLEDDANVGDLGNENGMFVCHPDGHTPEDYVVVFTYELTGNKVDGETNAALPGAGFTLYKKDLAATTEDQWVAVGEEVKGEDITSFTWSGLDDGIYKLVETTTPAGYNTMVPMEFTITAQHKDVWSKDGNSAFMDLIAKDGEKIVFADMDDQRVEDGKLSGTLINNKGAVLPETGANGTVIFSVIGTVLAMAAVVFMVTRKKMSAYED